MNCYLPTSNIRTSPPNGSPDSIIHQNQFVSHPASTFDTTSSINKKRKASYTYEAPKENSSNTNSMAKTMISNNNTSPAGELQIAKRQKLPRTTATTTSSSSSSNPINNCFPMATTVANPASDDAASQAAAAAAVSNNTPPASPESSNTLSNKSSASSLNSNSSTNTASSSVITDCSLNYFDTLPTNINKICSTTASHGDPWDLSEDALHTQKRHNQHQYQHHYPHQIDETQASSFSDPETSIISKNNNSYKTHSSNAVAEMKQPKLASELQEIESFYIGWRKNFEKWLLMKNPKKYNEFKSFLKFNSVDKEGLDFEQYAKLSHNKRSSPVSSPVKGQQHYNHNQHVQQSIRNSHSQSYHYQQYQSDKYSNNYNNYNNNNDSTSDSSIRNKINQYLVKKPVFNSKISKKFKNKSNEMILNNIIKKRNDTTSLMSYSHHSAAIGKSINSLERHKISNSAGASSVAAAAAAATPRSIAREHNGNSSSSIKLSPILSIPKANDHESTSATNANNNSNANNNTTTAKNERSGQAIRLPSINEILDSESFSVTKISSPSRSSSSSTYLPNNNAAVAVGDRRSISTSSVESANSVFSDNGTANAQSSFLADDGLNSGAAAAAAATSKLSPPLIAFKSSSAAGSNNQSKGNNNYYMSRLPDALTPTLHSSASPYPPVFPSYQHHQHQFHHHHQLASPATSPEKKSPSKKSTSVSPSKKSASSSSGTSNSTHHGKRTCLSCGSSSSPCWRPSWSLSEGQLCNSCGLRYKKTNARCLNDKCLRIPAKGEFGLIKNKANGIEEDYRCLRCSCHLELKKA